MENGVSGTSENDVPETALPAGENDGDDVSGTSGEATENPANFPFWHVPEENAARARNDVPEVANDDVPEDETTNVPELGAGWRIEVTNRGLYWQWRKGSHGNRVSRKGGKFQALSEERKNAYDNNRRQDHNRKQQATLRGGQAKGRRA